VQTPVRVVKGIFINLVSLVRSLPECSQRTAVVTVMSDPMQIPMFPLTLLPLPGELVPLHIFEPRYRQLLDDAETLDVAFGIYCTHECNKDQVGALMKLESVIKRYASGESDIVVRCVDVFSMDKMYRTYRNKMYPGGDVRLWKTELNRVPGVELYESFLIYQTRRNIHQHPATYSIYQVAQELNLDLFDRYRFLVCPEEKKESFLLGQLKFRIHILGQEEKSRDVFHLN
jgi:Lon protease-like protein